MTKIQSMESLALQKIHDNSEEAILLDYSEYYKDATEHLKSIEMYQMNILEENNNLSYTLKVFKNEYAKLSMEDATTTIQIRKSFGAKIRDFFSKVWATIVAIFEKIWLMVVSLIKSIILYFNKKRLSNQIVVKKCEDVIREISSNMANNALDKLNMDVLKQNAYSFAISEKNDLATFTQVHDRLNNKVLKEFMQNNTIYVNNRKSVFNLDYLEELFKDNIKEHIILDPNVDVKYSEITKNDKFTYLLTQITALTDQAILSAEVHDNDLNVRASHHQGWIKEVYSVDKRGVSDTDINPNYVLAETDNLKLFSNLLVYRLGVPKVQFIKIPMKKFIGLADHMYSDNRPAIVSHYIAMLNMYKNDFNLVCGNGGYVEVLQKSIEAFNKIAKGDKDRIKQIKKYVDEQLNVMAKDDNQAAINDTEPGKKVVNKTAVLQGQLKIFTKIISRVNNVKAKFVALRQYIMGDIVNMLHMEETLIRAISKTVDKNKFKEADFTDPNWNHTDTGINNLVDDNEDYIKNDESDESLKEVGESIDDKFTNVILPKITEKMEIIDKKLEEGTNFLVDGIVNTSDKLANKAVEFIEKHEKKDDDEDSYDDDYDYDDF